MKIGLVDVDGHNFSNLPLMKLSAYHIGIFFPKRQMRNAECVEKQRKE